MKPRFKFFPNGFIADDGAGVEERGARCNIGFGETDVLPYRSCGVADFEAQVAAENIVASKKGISKRSTIDYTAVPSVLFTYPQYAMVGMTEAALTQKGVDYKKSFGKSLSWPTYRRVGLKGAAYKVLTDKEGAVLGAHIISDNATGLINTFSLAMNNKINVNSLYRQSIMTPYPSRESDIIYMLSSLTR
ncbi:MAG: hypothetical protein P8Y36_14890 [Alphaproteobacteria bacterium]